MTAPDHSHYGQSTQGSFWTSRVFLVCAAFLLIGLTLLWTEHLAHALGYLPYVLIYEAQRKGALATSGPYAYVRHPQYLGFILVMFGFLLQWPTLLTLAMFPILVCMYVRLAWSEEREAVAAFADAYREYAARVPGFRLNKLSIQAIETHVR